MVRTVRILMLCIVLMGLASCQIRSAPTTRPPENSTTSPLERLFSNQKGALTEENFPKFNPNFLPKNLQVPATEKNQLAPIQNISRFAANPRCLQRSSSFCKQCQGKSQWVKKINMFGKQFEIRFTFEAKYVYVNGECICKHFVTIQSACAYKVICYQACSWTLGFYTVTIFGQMTTSAGPFFSPTPDCMEMDPFCRFINIGLLFGAISNLETSPAVVVNESSCLLFVPGCGWIPWGGGMPPAKAKDIWFCP